MTGAHAPVMLTAAMVPLVPRQEGDPFVSLFIWMVVGAVAGWLAGKVRLGGGFGTTSEIILGIVAAVAAGLAAGLIFGVNIVSGFSVETVVVAFLAALVVIAITRVLKPRVAGAS